MKSNSWIDRILRGVLKPFGTTPEAVSRRIGVVPIVLGSLFVRQTDRLYDYIGSQPGLGSFLNVGWWEEPSEEWSPPESFDMTKQCGALVRRVGEKAELGAEANLLDVGFGYGEQDRIFLDEFDCGRITGINITSSQVQEAYRKLDRFVSRDRVALTTGDAVSLPFAASSFNRLIALESPFHFHTRKDFLQEAYRVLKPGSKMVITDIINGYPEGEAPLSDQMMGLVHDYYWQVDDENYCTIDDYRDQLSRAGFNRLHLEDVTERTLVPGLTRYLRWRLEKEPAHLRWPAKPFVNWALNFYSSGYLRYVIVTARKPES
jgi:ubiquinone/menaquinone biosynthesis C-methylase UbiE